MRLAPLVDFVRGRWRLRLRERSGEKRRRYVGSYATEAEARAAAAEVMRDPESHWREETRRGPKPKPCRWCVCVRKPGPRERTWSVVIERVEGRQVTRRSISRHATQEEAEAAAKVVRLDPEAHWPPPREPKRRAVKTEKVAMLAAPTGSPTKTRDGWWLLPCGLHESREARHRCATCERAEALNAAARDELARSRAVVSQRRATVERSAA